jgi:hypothetical protein
MKPGHAAAFAISVVVAHLMVACTAQPTAWYLMKPPLHVRTPYSDSDRVETFDSKTKCDGEASRRSGMVFDPVAGTVEFQGGGYWKCVANNDPLAANLTPSH